MPLMTWTDKLSVGVPSIDEQHKKLVNILNNLFDSMQEGKGRDVLGAILDELINYTVEHFTYEENIFNRTGYMDTISHKKEHETLKQKVLAIQERQKAAVTGALSLEVVNFLKTWLTQHIQGTDMKYGPYLASKGIV